MICPNCKKDVGLWKIDTGWQCPVCDSKFEENIIMDSITEVKKE